MLLKNPCVSCGACCSQFRVSFYWAEASDATPGGVPVELTEPAPIPHRIMMRGTGASGGRCIALSGTVGTDACCSIHPRRPSPCREFPASYADGKTASPDCDAARARFGFPPLKPEDWQLPQPDPESPPREPLRPAA